jgi:hypothetical protein
MALIEFFHLHGLMAIILGGDLVLLVVVIVAFSLPGNGKIDWATGKPRRQLDKTDDA